MTDRELLELAAKAAGIKIEPCTCSDPRFPFRRKGNLGNRPHWNPLADDGDALRLAVDLGLRIRIKLDPFRFTEICLPNTGWYSAPVYHNDDRYAATRRAIVRAAAEIGERMK